MVTYAGPLYAKQEIFELSNNWHVEIYYGLIYSPKFPNNTDFINVKTRTSGVLRYVKLFKDNILICEHIEDNSNYCSMEDIYNACAEWVNKGEEFEREIHFDNGYIFKIEYWFSKNKQEPNRGIYFSKFHKLILYNSNKEIISEIIEENPNYRNPKIIDEIDENLF